jgi:hypothetical protein
LNRYFDLPGPGKQLIAGWWSRQCSGTEPEFEHFLYTWVAFNAWGECVSGLERDRDWVVAVAASASVRPKAEAAMEKPTVRDACSTFRRNWPLFRQRDLKTHGVAHLSEPDRSERIKRYLEKGVPPAAPECWSKHADGCPLDWPHLLLTVYRVRNNLFHGTKIVDSEMDRTLVAAATGALRAVVEEARLIVACP